MVRTLLTRRLLLVIVRIGVVNLLRCVAGGAGSGSVGCRERGT